jgi:hypothetical protein
MTDRNVEAVREKLLQRSERGIQKYGVTTDKAGLSRADWLRHLQDELLDGAVFLNAALAFIALLVAWLLFLTVSASLNGEWAAAMLGTMGSTAAAAGVIGIWRHRWW